MTIEEAKSILNEISKNYPYTKQEQFQMDELSKYIFEQDKIVEYASFLANEYEKNKMYDLALYYHELSIKYGYKPGYLYAGRMYLEGKTSNGQDLKKALIIYVKHQKQKQLVKEHLKNHTQMYTMMQN